MGRFVIVAYRPHRGKEKEFLKVLKKHLPLLRKEGLATRKPAYIMRAKNGIVLEVFEWTSAESIEEAHNNSKVLQLWGQFAEVCDYELVSRVRELREPFSEFESIDLNVVD